MTTTQDIAGLMAANTELKQYYEGIRADIDARVLGLVSRWDSAEVVWCVDQATGSDAAAGTQAAPLASIQEAINRTPYGRAASIRIRGTYTTTRRYYAFDRRITLIGCDAAWGFAAITMNIGFGLDAGTVETWGFRAMAGGAWDLYRINLKAATAANVAATYPGAVISPIPAAIFSRRLSADRLAGEVMFRYVDIDITADPYCTLFPPATATWRWEVFSVTTTSPMAGRYVAGVAAGTLSKDVPAILTNLQTL